MIDFAYARLNLRYNPFGELERQQRIDNAIARCDLESIEDFLRSGESTDSRRAVQFIGEPGSGKSTHLLMLLAKFSEFHFVHIPVNCTRQVPTSRDVMIDEAQRLVRPQRSYLLRNARRLAFGTHRCFRRKLALAGFTVKTVSLDQIPNAEWLSKTLNKKIASARRSQSNPPPQILHETVLKLIDKFGNNIRGMERELYETFHSWNRAKSSESSGASLDAITTQITARLNGLQRQTNE